MRTHAWIIGLVAVAATTPLQAQDHGPAPLVRPGEELTYEVRTARFGVIGNAKLRVDADTINGRKALRLAFDFGGRVALFKVEDRTRSWLDPETLSTLRYSKSEKSPIGGRNELVDVSSETLSWTEKGQKNPLACPEPLDELAIIYLIRALEPGVSMTVTRHFDEERNPIAIESLGQQTVEALGGEQAANAFRMVVPDARQKGGKSELRFYISNDDARVPLRIESRMPVAGAMTLTLVGVTPGAPASRYAY